LYTGNGVGYPSGPTITNGIDLSGKGGMVWGKSRSGAFSNWVYDTARGVGNALSTNSTSAAYAGGATAGANSFNSNGFGFGDNIYNENSNGYTYASWTFRKQAKFFDIVTYTGTGTDPQTISHNLGSAPGCMIVKKTNTSSSWYVYHIGTTSPANSKILYLDLTNAENATSAWNSYTPTSTNFQVAGAGTNASGATYVAYLFASNAGGFGSAGTDNVITCGSFTGNATVNLGYEPQWVMIKRTDSSASNASWYMFDNMRGFYVDQNSNTDNALCANLSNAEFGFGALNLNSTGFQSLLSGTYIYIAIRRGPMKTPTTGTSVFSPVTRTGTGATATVTTNIVTDLAIIKDLNPAAPIWQDRLRGTNEYLRSDSTSAAQPTGNQFITGFDTNTGFIVGPDGTGYVNYSGEPYVNWAFARAPGFFDEVCYSGTAVAGQTFNHNLTVVPEMMIVKMRSTDPTFGSFYWVVYHSALGNTKAIYLNYNNAPSTGIGFWNNTTPTNSVFSLGSNFDVNDTNGGPQTYVWYGFATVAGVSKVGTFTGTGGTQTIDCGFGAGGARWLMVKRTDSTGNWYVFDSARGFTSSSSPYLLMNSTAAQVTGNNGCYASSSGFTVTSTASATVNINTATYIYLAIA
jgi:hypothetical protein